MKMKPDRKIALFFFAALFVFFPVFLVLSSLHAEEEQEEAVAMLTETSGSVLVKDAQETSFKKAKKDQPLYEGDEIQTKKGASCEIEMKTESVVHLEENSYLKLSETKETSTGTKTTLKLFSGKILNVVNKLSNSVSSYNVETPTSIAGVRGTEFAVEAEEENTDVGVFSGNVAVKGLTQSGEYSEEVNLQEDMETSIKKFQKPFEPQKLKEKMQRWKQFLMKHRPRLYEKLKRSPELRQKLKKFVRRKMMLQNKKNQLKKQLKKKLDKMPGTPEEKKKQFKEKFKEKKEKRSENGQPFKPFKRFKKRNP